MTAQELFGRQALRPELASEDLLTRLMFVPDHPVAADATIVLGMSLWQNPVAAALGLMRKGCAGTLVFTGGPNPRIGRAEAEVMAEAAIAQGAPRDKILSEPCARHTGENLQYSWDLIQRNLPQVQAVNIVAIAYHIPRALMTARAVLGPKVALGHFGYGSVHFNADTWHRSDRGRRDVLTEAAKLARYFPDAIPFALRGPLHEG